MYRIDLLTFVDFVLTGGPKRLALAAPPRPEHFDFWVEWRASIRGGINPPPSFGDMADERKLRIYPVHLAGYRAANEAAGARSAPLAEPNTLVFGELTVDAQPDVSVMVGGAPVDLWCHHGVGGGPCSRERMALILVGAKLAGFHPAVVDVSPKGSRRLVHWVPDMSDPADVALLFRAEATAFLMFRRHAEARAK